MDEYLDSFSHGPVISKLWLCLELENILSSLNYTNPTVNILGGWVNVLGFMMQVRKPNYYREINSYDSDPESTRMSDRLCDAWRIERPKINNKTSDVRHLKFNSNIPEQIFINCSVDQFIGTKWYDNIPDKSIVCLQTTTFSIEDCPWTITQETKDINELLEKYKLSKILFAGEKNIKYNGSHYVRLMSIGIK
jgi:hypothetical protein